MTIEIVRYTPAHESAWDNFCADAVNATFLHTQGFVGYHGDRFKDLSVLMVDAGKVVGVFPAAESPADNLQVVSHPGITYGGVVHQGRLGGARMIDALTTLCRHYKERGYRSLQYKVVPHIYTALPAQDDLYALFRLGAQRLRCDLSCTIDLRFRGPLGERRRRGLKKAQKLVALSDDPALLEDWWTVLADNLARKHGAQPVHSVAELSLLRARFPDQIALRCALSHGRVEAGVLLFNTPLVWHAQYIAASENAYDMSALDAVFDSAISEAQQAGARYFDFGISNEDSGKILNDGLYRFKLEFGGGGAVHEFYLLNL